MENDVYHLSQEFNDNAIDLLKKKRLNSFDYQDSFEKFKEGLPSKDKFCSTLANRDVSNKNYKHVLNVWKAFKMNTMKDHHDLYLKVDILLLTCVVENFRKECMNSFELNPAHFLSTPSYSWNALLKFTDVNLKLISYIEVSIH